MEVIVPVLNLLEFHHLLRCIEHLLRLLEVIDPVLKSLEFHRLLRFVFDYLSYILSHGWYEEHLLEVIAPDFDLIEFHQLLRLIFCSNFLKYPDLLVVVVHPKRHWISVAIRGALRDQARYSNVVWLFQKICLLWNDECILTGGIALVAKPAKIL